MTKQDDTEQSIDTPFMDLEGAASYLKMKPGTLKNHRFRGTGPNYRKHGGIVVYHREDLEDWSKSRTIKGYR